MGLAIDSDVEERVSASQNKHNPFKTLSEDTTWV